MIFHNDNCEITETAVRHEARSKTTLYNHMQSFRLLVRIDRTHRFFDGPRNVKFVRLVRLECTAYLIEVRPSAIPIARRADSTLGARNGTNRSLLAQHAGSGLAGVRLS